MKAKLELALLLLLPAVVHAQVPVDEDGNIIGEYESQANFVLLSHEELQDLVGPIALYPDDLLAIVLPASAYPLQVVEAARFLDAYEQDSSLEPSADWDESVVALTNYPEVVALLNEDLDWTLRLGEAVVAQQTDVISAVETFRDRAYAAGNLNSDEYQTVSENDGVIYISPAEDDAIYVPYYEPEQVVYYQPRPVYYYHPRPRPIYYYPYASGHHFNNGYFWGVTTAFSIGWLSDSLHTYHYSYQGHPYYGRSYWNHWYRRPSISVYNNYYNYNNHASGSYLAQGNRWTVREQRREYVRREGYNRNETRLQRRSGGRSDTIANRQPAIAFRQRDTTVAVRREPSSDRTERRSRTESRNHNRNQPVRTSRDRQVPEQRDRRVSVQPDKDKRAVQVPPSPARSNQSNERRTSSHRLAESRTDSRASTRRTHADSREQSRRQDQSVRQPRATNQLRPQQRSQPQSRSQPQQRAQPQSRSQPQQRAQPQQRQDHSSNSSSRSSSRSSETRPHERRR